MCLQNILGILDKPSLTHPASHILDANASRGLLIVEVLTHLQIFWASILGPDSKLTIWLLETSQLVLKIWEIWFNIIVYGMLLMKVFA